MTLRRMLLIALAVQCVLAVLTWWPEDRSAERARPLVDWPRESIDAIEITRAPTDDDPEPAGVSLARVDGEWQIASEYGYRADEVKLTALLDRLLGLTIRAPIATTPSSHNALSVGDREYGRHVTLHRGDETLTLVLGPASADRVYARVAGEDAVYLAKGAAEWSFSDRESIYRPAHYVDVAPESLTTLSVTRPDGDIRFTREDGAWSLVDPPAEGTPDPAKIRTLVSTLLRLPMGAVASDEARPEYALGSAGSVTWTEASDSESRVGGYAIGAQAGAERYVKADGQRHVVLLPESALTAALTTRATDLMADEAAAEADTAADAAP